MTSLARKILLGLTLLAVLGVVALLTSRRFAPDPGRRTDGLLLEMITNVSSDLDRLDNRFDDITTQTEVARNRLRQLVALHRENLFVCAILAGKRGKRGFTSNESALS